MLFNYIKIFFRNLRRHPGYSLLNILGLTSGIASSLVIFLFVQDEFNYDKNHTKGEQIYRLECRYYLPKDAGYEDNATIGPPVVQNVVNDYPEALQSVRFQRRFNRIVEKTDATRFYETIYYADSNVFQLFDFPFIEGDPNTALGAQNKMVITESTAEKYFGTTSALGQTLKLPEDSIEFEITGIIKDLPANTHIKFDFLASLTTIVLAPGYQESWWGFSTWSYIEVAPNTDVANLESKIKRISANYIASQEEGSGYYQEYSLTNLFDIHLYSDIRGEMEPNSRAANVYIFLAIGIFLIVIASINFMNLATARSALRAKEIGIRKVTGAYRQQLISQFIGEALMMTFLSTLLAVLVIALFISYVNEFSGKELTLNVLENPGIVLYLVASFIVIGVLAGIYPALFLSRFKPSETLKGSFKSSSKGGILRKTLVILQFTISIILICGTAVVYKQLSFMQSKDLGFKKEQVIVIPTRYTATAIQDFDILKKDLLNLSTVSETSLSSRVPGNEMGNNVVRKGWDPSAEWSDMRFLSVDHEFVELYELELMAGRSFNVDMSTDEQEAFILNESGMNRLGYTNPEEFIGTPLRWQNRRGRVIGVVKDFHFMSPNQAIQPFIMVMNGGRTPGYLSIKVSTREFASSIESIESIFNQIMPSRIFEYEFLDEQFQQQYESDQRFMKIVTLFSALAIFIACLGLYGLASFITELKFKEIGIRKVLGASPSQLILMLNKEFTLLVLVSIIIAVPTGFFLSKDWILSFPYQTELGIWLFLLSGLVALVIAWLTVAYHSYKAARVNPVDSIGQG